MDAENIEGSIVKHPFMSEGWLAIARDEIEASLAANPISENLRCSAIERFLDLPSDAPRPAVGEPAFKLVIADGDVKVSYGAAPGDGADVEIECTWNDAWRSASLHHGSELEALHAEQIAGNRLRIKGSLGAIAPILRAAHDRVADQTIPPPS